MDAGGVLAGRVREVEAVTAVLRGRPAAAAMLVVGKADVGKSRLVRVAEMLVIGLGAAAIGFGIGRLFQAGA